MRDEPFAMPPAEPIERGRESAPADGVHATPIAGLQLLRLDRPGAPLPALYEPELVVQGRKVAMLGTQRPVYDPLHCLVVGVPMLPAAQVVEASPQRPYLRVRLQVDPREIGQLVLAPLIQREIFYRVLTGELGARLRALAVAGGA